MQMKKWITQIGTTIITVLALWYVLPAKEKIIVRDSGPDVRQVHYKNLTDNINGDFTHAADITLPSVVHIEVIRESDQSPTGATSGTGSGVIIDDSGFIVTNNHVIDEGENILVTLHDNRKFPAELIGNDPSTDLAVIKIQTENLKALAYGNSDDLLIGEWVAAVGNPYNLTSTVTAGIVSAKGREIRLVEDRAPIESFIQTDAAVNPGNSGGALVDRNGRLIGINTAILGGPSERFSGYSFAIPINLAGKIIDDLIEFGTVQRGWLGVLMVSVDDQIARQMNLPTVRGTYITEVMSGSAAADISLKAGDIILSVNEYPINTVADLTEIVGRHRPGDSVIIEFYRSGEYYQGETKLKGRSDNGNRREGAQFD